MCYMKMLTLACAMCIQSCVFYKLRALFKYPHVTGNIESTKSLQFVEVTFFSKIL